MVMFAFFLLKMKHVLEGRHKLCKKIFVIIMFNAVLYLFV